MFDLSAYDPAGKTAQFQLPIRGALVPREPGPEDPPLAEGEEAELVEGQPYLVCRHAGDGNKGYMNAITALTLKAARRPRKAPDAEQITARVKEDRNQDRHVFPDFVIVGWGNMPGPDRQPVPFSRPVCRELIKALPDWMMDNLRVWAKNPLNFIADQDQGLALEEADVEAAAGN